MRAEGLVHLTNAVKAFPLLETLDLSHNQLARNSFGDQYPAGLETFCASVWQAAKLVDLECVSLLVTLSLLLCLSNLGDFGIV